VSDSAWELGCLICIGKLDASVVWASFASKIQVQVSDSFAPSSTGRS
jgi:hypothetical protein